MVPESMICPLVNIRDQLLLCSTHSKHRPVRSNLARVELPAAGSRTECETISHVIMDGLYLERPGAKPME